MAEFNRQQAFDTALNGLRKQGCKSLGDPHECLYRGEGGTKCAVGFLIPNERYSIRIEGRGAMHYSVREACGASKDHEEFLCRLQSDLHDTQDCSLTLGTIS